MTIARRALALATLLLLPAMPAVAATPAPAAAHPAVLPTPTLPKQRLHTEFVVQVNDKGQVVGIVKKKGCPNLFFNTQTFGNVLQMWIRHPDGTAQTGLYKVSYDYNPSTKRVRRSIALLSSGGTWADKPGAATAMMDAANKEAQREQQIHNANLPSLDTLMSSPKPSPTRHP